MSATQQLVYLLVLAYLTSDQEGIFCAREQRTKLKEYHSIVTNRRMFFRLIQVSMLCLICYSRFRFAHSLLKTDHISFTISGCLANFTL